MEAERTSEMVVSYNTTRRHSPEDLHLKHHCRESFQTHVKTLHNLITDLFRAHLISPSHPRLDLPGDLFPSSFRIRFLVSLYVLCSVHQTLMRI